jgi:peptidyl-tRNA hydrolase, PTH1 family
MKLIVGLGNPGKKYDDTRHNFGFMIVKEFGPFIFDKTFNALINKTTDVIFAMPQTFMNESGVAVQKITAFFKIEPDDIWVIHDDIDLPLGEVRMSQGQSSAGHKGVESIIASLSTKDFHRLRLGIMNDTKGLIPTEKFVLQNFTDAEKPIIAKTINTVRGKIIQRLQNETSYQQ